jgi:type VI secretion system VasD/TssJ family lipoprotein
MTGRVFVVLAVAVIGSVACHSKPPKPPQHRFCLEGGPNLNWYGDTAHTLFVRLLQLTTLDGFTQADASRLLDSNLTLPGLVGTPTDETVHPGATVSLRIRQQPDAVYLGLVAGYYRPQGPVKTYVRFPAKGSDEDDDEEEKGKPRKPPGGCIRFGSNRIDSP